MQSEAQEKEIEETTSVELEADDSQDDVVEAASDSEENQETRTNVQDNDNELDEYSENVQKRIRKLTAARRKAEEEAAAAVQYIQQVQAQNEQYKQRLSTVNTGYISEYEGRISSQEAQAKRALAEAHEAGDYEKVADAQSAIAQIAIEKERLRVQKNKSQNVANQQQPEVQAQTPTPQPQQRDPKLESWLGKNQWFGKDKIMTSSVPHWHRALRYTGSHDRWSAGAESPRACLPCPPTPQWQTPRQEANQTADARNGPRHPEWRAPWRQSTAAAPVAGADLPVPRPTAHRR